MKKYLSFYEIDFYILPNMLEGAKKRNEKNEEKKGNGPNYRNLLYLIKLIDCHKMVLSFVANYGSQIM